MANAFALRYAAHLIEVALQKTAYLAQVAKLESDAQLARQGKLNPEAVAVNLAAQRATEVSRANAAFIAEVAREEDLSQQMRRGEA